MLFKLLTRILFTFSLIQSLIAFDSGFTIVIATYQRDHLLPSLLSHLITSPPSSLKSIILLWQNAGTPLPSFLQPIALAKLSASNRSLTISVRLSPKNSMNERFRPSDLIKTEAVLILDDDIVLTNSVLEWGYQEYLLANPLGSDSRDGRIVGFTPREFREIKSTTFDPDGIMEWEYLIRSKDSYSIILSNAAWIRREWMEMYWVETQEMIGLRKFVDDVFNCDDILLNFLVSNFTQLPPLLLQPSIPLRTILTPGLWNRTSQILPPGATITPAPQTTRPISELSHFETRPKCLAHFFKHFKQFNPDRERGWNFPLLQTSSSISQDLLDHSRIMKEGESWDEDREIWVLFEGESEGNGSSAGTVEEEDQQWRELNQILANLTVEELQDQREWDERLSKMSDEEVQILMMELEEDMKKEDEEELEWSRNQTRKRDEL